MTKEILKNIIDEIGEEIFDKEYKQLFSVQFSDKSNSRLSLLLKAGIKLENESQEIKNSRLKVRIFTHSVKKGYSVLEIATVGKEYYKLLKEQKTLLPNIYLVTSDGKSRQAGRKIVETINYPLPQKRSMSIDAPHYATCLNFSLLPELEQKSVVKNFIEGYFKLLKTYA